MILPPSLFLAAPGPGPSSVAPGGEGLLAAFDQAALAAVLLVGALLGLAANQPTEPPKRHRVWILPSSLLHRCAPSLRLLPLTTNDPQIDDILLTILSA